MTNIALLLKVFPKVANNIEKVVLMGGAAEAGNFTPYAEFNLFCDPDAARVVFNAGLSVYMVPLEVTHTALFTDQRKDRMEKLNTKFSAACIEMLEFYKEAYIKQYGFEYCPLHDPCAVAYCIASEIFDVNECRVEVDIGLEKKGMTTCDLKHESEKKANVHVAIKMDVEKFWELMLSAVESASEKSRIEK